MVPDTWCTKYVTKYAMKSESRSKALKEVYGTIMKLMMAHSTQGCTEASDKYCG